MKCKGSRRKADTATITTCVGISNTATCGQKQAKSQCDKQRKSSFTEHLEGKEETPQNIQTNYKL